jgi:hypothetical protein
MNQCMHILVVSVLFVVTAPALAQPTPAASELEPAPAETGEAASQAGPEVDQLTSRLADLESRLTMSELNRKSKFPIKLSGYGDLGFFATQGDGAGFRRDAGHVIFPTRSQYGWVFYGDLMATSVNSRGDAADLGDAPGVDRLDTIGSGGRPTFLVNELNLSVHAGLGEAALFTTSVNFLPRTGRGREFSVGDSFDVDIVQIEWMPTSEGKTSVFVGKVDSVIGIEYKTRKPPQRFGITPSLLARYTTGTAVGVKARTKLLDDHVILAAAVTNGSFGTEQFHFFAEGDANTFKTLSGRAAYRATIGALGVLEVGGSAQGGTQDGAPDGAGAMWFVGLDAELDTGRINLKAQYLKGRAPGDPASMTYSLDLKNGGYLEADVIVTPLFGVIGRAELRDAEVAQGTERLYITKNWRATAGARLNISPSALVKVEVSHNGEYGGVPSIPDDLVTLSAVMAF